MVGTAIRWHGFRLAAVFGLAAAVLLPAGADAGQTGTRSRPALTVIPHLTPSFAWKKRDYVIRCSRGRTRGRVKVPNGWQAKLGGSGFRSRNFARRIRTSPGARFTFVVRKSGRTAERKKSRRAFHVRCLPEDFAPYEFVRSRAGGPRLMFVQMKHHYATIFDRNGVPVWWYKASGFPDNAELLPDETVAWAPVDAASYRQGDYEIRNLSGRFLRTVSAAGGLSIDVHELLLLPGGNYLTGAFRNQSGLDATPFGGTIDATVRGAEVQELRPDGSLAWSWNSEGRIGLAETGRWWDYVLTYTRPYDVVHWNSVERNGDRMLMSFRHLDAVYEIDRASGEILWKLGGTTTPESLTVTGDPSRSYPLGGQHDARRLPNGDVSIFDNETGLDKPPRVVRYRIDENRGEAKLVQSFTDPEVPDSVCCGSARKLPSGDWLVGWGGVEPDGLVGSYDSKGRPVFRLWTPDSFSYRAHPITDRSPKMKRLRSAMDKIGGNDDG